jgi:hypothetical protein
LCRNIFSSLSSVPGIRSETTTHIVGHRHYLNFVAALIVFMCKGRKTPLSAL